MHTVVNELAGKLDEFCAHIGCTLTYHSHYNRIASDLRGLMDGKIDRIRCARISFNPKLASKNRGFGLKKVLEGQEDDAARGEYRKGRIINYEYLPSWIRETIDQLIYRKFKPFKSCIELEGAPYSVLHDIFNQGHRTHGLKPEDILLTSILTFNQADGFMKYYEFRERSPDHPLHGNKLPLNRIQATPNILGGTEYGLWFLPSQFINDRLGLLCREIFYDAINLALACSIVDDTIEISLPELSQEQRAEFFRVAGVKSEADAWQVSNHPLFRQLILAKNESKESSLTHKVFRKALYGRLGTKTGSNEPSSEPDAQSSFRSRIRSILRERGLKPEDVTSWSGRLTKLSKLCPSNIEEEIIKLLAQKNLPLEEIIQRLQIHITFEEKTKKTPVLEEPTVIQISNSVPKKEYSLISSAQYKKWYDKLDQRERRAVDNRLERVRQGSLGDFKRLQHDTRIIELRIKSSRELRIYCTLEGEDLMIIAGGFKAEQKKQIPFLTPALDEFLRAA